MIYVTVSKNEAGMYDCIRMKGHAGYAERGQDIVCAAVSALLINTVNSIEQFTSDQFQYEQEEKNDQVVFRLVSDISSETKLLMDSLVLGLQAIEETYDREYIRVTFQ